MFVLTVAMCEARLAEISRAFERSDGGLEFVFKSAPEQSLTKPLPRLLCEP
jgi:hypothetical protein